MRSHRRVLIIGAALLLLIVGGSTIYIIGREPPLTKDAEAVLTAMLEGDSNVLYEHILEHERSINKLNFEKVRAIVEQVIVPNLSSFTMREKPGSQITSSNDDQAAAWLPLRHSSGRDATLYVNVYQTERGGQTTLTAMLYHSWIVKYTTELELSDELPTARRQAVIKGLETDTAKLKELGMNFSVDPNPLKEPLSLEEHLAKARELLNTHLAKAAKPK